MPLLYITSHGRRTGKGFCSVSSVFSLVASISDKAVMYRVNSSKLTEPSLSNQHVDGTREEWGDGGGRRGGWEDGGGDGKMEGGGDGGCGDGKMEEGGEGPGGGIQCMFHSSLPAS